MIAHIDIEGRLDVTMRAVEKFFRTKIAARVFRSLKEATHAARTRSESCVSRGGLIFSALIYPLVLFVKGSLRSRLM